MAKGQEEKSPTRNQDTNKQDANKHEEQGKQLIPVRQNESSMAANHRGNLAPSQEWEPLSRWRGEFDNLFDHLFDQFSRQMLGVPSERLMSGWGLAVKEEDNHLIVRAEAPGFESNDFDIQLRGDQLILRASHKSEEGEKDDEAHTWRRQEFYRSVMLPPGIDQEKVKAAYRNGVLTVILQKTEESKGKRIKVD